MFKGAFGRNGRILFSPLLSVLFAMWPILLCPELGGLRPKLGGDGVRFYTVAEAIKHLKTKGIHVWPARVSRAVEKGASRSGWSFRFTSHEDAAQPPATPGSRPAEPAEARKMYKHHHHHNHEETNL